MDRNGALFANFQSDFSRDPSRLQAPAKSRSPDNKDEEELPQEAVVVLLEVDVAHPVGASAAEVALSVVVEARPEAVAVEVLLAAEVVVEVLPVVVVGATRRSRGFVEHFYGAKVSKVWNGIPGLYENGKSINHKQRCLGSIEPSVRH
jgi:hypothetical protein